MHDYWNEKTSHGTFKFSVTNRFSLWPLFHPFYPKIYSSAHFDSVFSNTGRFNRKTKNTVRFSIIIIRISIFMHLRLKLTSEICQKVASLDLKTAFNSNFFFTFFYPCDGRESIVFGSNFWNRGLDGLTRYEVPWIRKSHFLAFSLCVFMSVYLLSA